MRGSARYFNDIFADAVERGRELIDHVTDTLTADGYPLLTKPITLRDLKKMPPAEATMKLRLELRRTMKKDELTGTPIPDKDTVKLATDYLLWSQGRTDEGGLGLIKPVGGRHGRDTARASNQPTVGEE